MHLVKPEREICAQTTAQTSHVVSREIIAPGHHAADGPLALDSARWFVSMIPIAQVMYRTFRLAPDGVSQGELEDCLIEIGA